MSEQKNELRWNPFFKKWIIVSPKRSTRPIDVKDQIVPSQQKQQVQKGCPFCVGAPEVPEPFDVLVLPNRFPALDQANTDVFTELRPESPFKIAPALGIQELVLYSPTHGQKLGDLSVDHVIKLVNVWKEEYIKIAQMSGIQYVYEFENRGAMIGVSLSHPHGQIYGFSWIPLYIQNEIASFKEYHDEHGRCLLCDVIKEEKTDNIRIIKENDNFIEIAPFYALWDHEVHLYPKTHVQSFTDFDDAMISDFADILKDINRRYDRLYPGVDFSFVMAIHQKPTNDENYDHYHCHVDFYPSLRSATLQKFAGGVELGTGAWLNSTLPEEFAERMREVDVDEG